MHLSRLFPNLKESERRVLKNWCEDLPKRISTSEFRYKFETDKIGKKYEHDVLKNKVRMVELITLYKGLGGTLYEPVTNLKIIKVDYDVMAGDRIKWMCKGKCKKGTVIKVYKNHFLCEFEFKTGNKTIKLKESLSFQDLKNCIIER